MCLSVRKSWLKYRCLDIFIEKHVFLLTGAVQRADRPFFLRAQKRLQSGLSICIFPEGLVPEEEVTLSTFKDGAFRLAINHNIDVVPITFYDNKKRFSYSFFSGGPGTLRVGIHKFLKTGHLNNGDTRELNKTAYDIIFKSLLAQ